MIMLWQLSFLNVNILSGSVFLGWQFLWNINVTKDGDTFKVSNSKVDFSTLTNRLTDFDGPSFVSHTKHYQKKLVIKEIQLSLQE